MKKELFLILICTIIYANARSQMVGPNVFLQGNWVEAGQARNGSFGSGLAPAGYHPFTGTNLAIVYDYGHDGWLTGTPPYFGDYTYPGTPFEGWSIEVNGARSDAFYTNSAGTGFWNANSSVSTLTGNNIWGTTSTAVWQGTAGPGGSLSITQTTTLNPTADWIIVNTVFQNTSSTTLTGLYYERTCDPDNEQTRTGDYETNNTIVYQNDVANRVLVNSRGTALTNAYLALGTKDCRAKAMIYENWPLPQSTALTLRDIYNETVPGTFGDYWYGTGETTLSRDIAIGLIYSLGSLAPGQSTTITYAYILDHDASIDVITFPPPPPMVIDAGTAICPGDICAGDLMSFDCDVIGNTFPGVWSITGGGSDVTIDPTWGWLTINHSMTMIRTVTVYYTVSNNCGTDVTSCTFKVYPSPQFTIAGPMDVCAGVPYTKMVSFTIPYPPPGTGHTYLWSTGGATTSSITRVHTSVLGLSIVYSVSVTNSWGCTTEKETYVSVHPQADAGTVTCPSAICAGDLMSFDCEVTGSNGLGVWYISGGGSDVTIDPTWGWLTINHSMTAPRIVTAYYVVTNFCGSDTAFCTFTVYPSPQFTITGPMDVCSAVPYTKTVSFTTPYPPPGTGHTYSWSTGATTSSITQVHSFTPGLGLVYTVSVTNTWGCSTVQETHITIHPNPPTPTIETCPPPLCIGQSATVWGFGTYPGSWSCSPASIVTLSSATSSSVNVTGASGGTATLTYTITDPSTLCSSYTTCTVTVNPSPVPITGPTSVCVGSSITLNQTVTGGVWSSSSGAIASVTNVAGNGLVTGISAGVVTITYNRFGCYTTYLVTVNPTPMPVISCVTDLCEGTSVGIAGDPAYMSGYTVSWTCTPTSGAIITLSSASSAGVLVTGTFAGTATLTYTVTNPSTGCSGTYICPINVHPAPPPIMGPSDMCEDETITLGGVPPGGIWISSNTTIATVNPTGDVTGVSGGTVIIDYVMPGPLGCYSSIIINVIPRAVACVKWGPDPGCSCNAFTFNGTPGALVNYDLYDCSGGMIASGSVTLDITGYAAVPSLSLPDDACELCITTIEYMGCRWSCLCPPGSVGDCCALRGADKPGLPEKSEVYSHLEVIPNPNAGQLTLRGSIATNLDVKVDIINALGQSVYMTVMPVKKGNIDRSFTLSNHIANGVYFIRVSNDEVNEVLRFVLRR